MADLMIHRESFFLELTLAAFDGVDGLKFTFKFATFVDSAKADEELVDQKINCDEQCKPRCVKPLFEYQACIKRVQGDESGEKHCTGQYFDYWSCVDKCAAPKIFAKLK